MGKRWYDGPGNIVAKAKVVVTALPTRLIAISSVIAFALPLLTNALPEYADNITLWGGRVIALLGAAVLIIRRVTPVDSADQVGILPQGPPSSPIVTINPKPQEG